MFLYMHAYIKYIYIERYIIYIFIYIYRKIYAGTNIESIGLKGAHDNAYPTPQGGSSSC